MLFQHYKVLQSEAHWDNWRGNRGANGWESVFFKSWNPPTILSPCLYNHICAHTRYTTGSCSPFAQAAATFSACALFSLSIAAGWEFLQYYLSSLRPTVQPSKAQEAQLHHKKTFLTGNAHTAAAESEIFCEGNKTERLTFTCLCSNGLSFFVVKDAERRVFQSQEHITVTVLYLVILFPVWSTWSARTPEPPRLLSACWW